MLIDACAPERFRGEHEPIHPVDGNVPGAINVPYCDVAEQGLPKEVLDADRVIVYCGSGVTACVVLHALDCAGRPDALLYPGLWSEWSRQGRPAEVGESG